VNAACTVWIYDKYMTSLNKQTNKQHKTGLSVFKSVYSKVPCVDRTFILNTVHNIDAIFCVCKFCLLLMFQVRTCCLRPVTMMW